MATAQQPGQQRPELRSVEQATGVSHFPEQPMQPGELMRSAPDGGCFRKKTRNPSGPFLLQAHRSGTSPGQAVVPVMPGLAATHQQPRPSAAAVHPVPASSHRAEARSKQAGAAHAGRGSMAHCGGEIGPGVNVSLWGSLLESGEVTGVDATCA